MFFHFFESSNLIKDFNKKETSNVVYFEEGELYKNLKYSNFLFALIYEYFCFLFFR